MATRKCCFCGVSLQKPRTMAATVALPFSCAMRATPVSKVAGVVTNVRCSGASLETGMPIFFPSFFLSFFLVQELFLPPITCKGLVVDRWFVTQNFAMRGFRVQGQPNGVMALDTWSKAGALVLVLDLLRYLKLMSLVIHVDCSGKESSCNRWQSDCRADTKGDWCRRGKDERIRRESSRPGCGAGWRPERLINLCPQQEKGLRGSWVCVVWG